MKAKRISSRNLPARFALPHVVTYWFLWDKFPQEWVRTILVILIIFHVIGVLIDIFYHETVDIFKEK